MSQPEALTAEESSIAPSSTPARGRGRIKVVFVIDNMRLGGTELNAVRTAERLDRGRFELRVVCLSGDGPLSARYSAIAIPVEYLNLRGFYGSSMLVNGWRFIQFLRREHADIVHAHDLYSNIFVTVWARWAGCQVVIVSRRWWHSSLSRRLRFGSRWAFLRANAVLANCAQVARSVTEDAKVPASKIWTITNFADEGSFGVISEKERQRVRREWNAPDEAVVIGCVARLEPVKGVEDLLRAFAHVKASNSQVLLVLIGDGDQRPVLESLAHELRLEDAVRFVGEIRNGGNLHRAFDISVLASRSEGFPNTLVEAMAAGRPVVATAVGGSVDAVRDGETGFLVPPGDGEALGKALLQLVENPALRSSMGTAALSWASESFQASRVISSLEDMYTRLLPEG